MTSDSSTGAEGSPTGIDVSINHASLSVDPVEVQRFVERVIRFEEVDVAYLGIILCDRTQHQELHRRFLGNPIPTDVLAFDLEPGSDRVDGEVYVDLDTAAQRHDEFGSSFREEVFRYVVHGVLHLIGYRDKNSRDADAMRKRQEMLLERFILPNSEPPG